MSTATVIATPKEPESPLIREISLNKIKPSKANPRTRTDENALAELAESIKTHGVLQPVLVRPVDSDGFEIVCGERRWRASKTAGKETIPARIVKLSDGEALELAVIENLQRENVHELDETPPRCPLQARLQGRHGGRLPYDHACRCRGRQAGRDPSCTSVRTRSAKFTQPIPSPSAPRRRSSGGNKPRSSAPSREYRKRLLTEVYKRVPGELGRHELGLIASSYFQQLGHDSQHRIFKLFAWEEVKTEAVNGGYRDYPKLVALKIAKMTTTEIGKFLVVCALATELYLPMFYGSTLPKDTKLAKEAEHYKVNCERTLREVKDRFTTKPARQKVDSKLPTSAKATGSSKGK